MCNMCVMMIEIKTIEGGQKRCLLTKGDQIYEQKIDNNIFPVRPLETAKVNFDPYILIKHFWKLLLLVDRSKLTDLGTMM